MKEVIEINGTYFYEGTDPKVSKIILDNIHSEKRLRFFYGTPEKYWLEEYDIIGTVGRTTGTKKMPLLIANIRSSGGFILGTDKIMMITDNKKIIYKNKDFSIKEFQIIPSEESYIKNGLTHHVIYDGEVVATFKSEEKAKNYIKFMKGEKNKK